MVLGRWVCRQRLGGNASECGCVLKQGEMLGRVVVKRAGRQRDGKMVVELAVWRQDEWMGW